MRKLLLLLASFMVQIMALGQYQNKSVYNLRNETVTSITQDGDGAIWFSTLRGVIKYSGSYSSYYFPGQDDYSLSDANNFDLVFDSEGVLWIANYSGIDKMTPDKKIIRFNFGMDICPIYRLGVLDNKRLVLTTHTGLAIFDKNGGKIVERYDNPIIANSRLLHISKDNRIWVASDFNNVMMVFNDSLTLIKSITFENVNRINDISEDIEGNIYVATDRGIWKIDSENYKFLPLPTFISEKSKDKNIMMVNCTSEKQIFMGIVYEGLYNVYTDERQILSIFPQEKLNTAQCVYLLDDRNSLWLSSETTGCKYYPQSTSSIVRYSGLLGAVQSKATSKIFEDSEHNIWTLTNNRILCYDKELNEVTEVTLPEYNNNPAIQTMFLTSKDHLWLQINNRELREYLITDNKLNFIGSVPFNYAIRDFYQNFWEDTDGNVYINISNNIYKLDSGLSKASPVNNLDGLNIFGSYRCFFNNKSSSTIVFGPTDASLMYKTANSPWIPVKIKTRDGSLVRPFIMPPYDDNDGDLWITSFSNLYRYNLKSGETTIYGTDDGLPGRVMTITKESKSRYVWFGTTNGLSRLHKDTGKIENYNIGREFDYFLPSMEDSEGIIYLSYSNGLTIIDPKDISYLNDKNIPLVIESIIVGNTDIGRVNENGITVYGENGMGINNPGTLKFKHTDNNVSFQFSGISYDNSLIEYLYMLEGIDDNWVRTGENSAKYSFLPAGNYNFMVKIAGETDALVLSFPFTIKNAPWFSTVAIILYSLFTILFTYFIINYFRQKRKREMIAREKLMIEQLNEMKINFFTNISHEFRTPLSLIYAPLKSLDKIELSPTSHYLIELMKRNVQKMLRLTNQLLEYNNIDKDFSKLNLEEKNVTETIKSIVDTFQFSAQENNVKFYAIGSDPLICNIDEVKLNRILSNLLSNAIKYSPGGGEVIINISIIDQNSAKRKYEGLIDECNYLEISISDNGIGIPEGKLSVVFDRYRREVADSDISHISGFGIGLHYTRQLVEVHRGAIKAAHNSPHGTIFSFVLPTDKSVYPIETVKEEKTGDVDPILPFDFESEEADLQKKYSILVVEDDNEMRGYISEILSPHYSVYGANNGKIALEMLEKFPVDIILCDIMMPVLNGYNLCKTVRDKLEWSSISIILLSGKAEVKDHINGLHLGIDTYINKPFDPDYLIAVIKNVISTKKRIQQAILNATPATLVIKEEKEQEPIGNSRDIKFIQELHKIMDDNISNVDFNINNMAQYLGMSRTGFYTKIKTLTGQKPIEFYNTYRLNKAAELLRTREYTASEVGYMVGFSALQSFSRSFQKKFNSTPSEYMKHTSHKGNGNCHTDPGNDNKTVFYPK